MKSFYNTISENQHRLYFEEFDQVLTSEEKFEFAKNLIDRALDILDMP